MLYKSYVETIVAIEQSFDVNSLKYKDMIIWPLIKMAIWRQISNPGMNFTRKEGGGNDQIVTLAPRKEELDLLSSEYKNTDTLFFTTRWGQHMDTLEGMQKLEGKFFSPFIDSMINLVRNNYSFLRMELYSHKIQQTISRFEPTFLLHPVNQGYTKDRIKFINNFNGLQKVIQDVSGIRIDEAFFLEQARSIFSWQTFFTKILSVVCPKSVFVVTYSQLTILPLIRACKYLKIPTVELQHGAGFSRFNIMTTHWTKIPSDGYDLLPDYFWCWGQSYKNGIEKWFSPECSHHRCIMGGNPKLAAWLNSKPNDDSDLEFFCEQLEKKKGKVILIAMSALYLKTVRFPDSLLDAMQRSPSDWLWLIRVHPFFRTAEKKERIVSVMQEYGIDNYEIEHSNSNSIYSVFNLLKICDHNITDNSTICQEALMFGVPSTLITNTALEAYGSEIEKGIFAYAETSEQILASIRQGKLNPQVDSSIYIETGKQVAEDALKMILNHSSQSFSNENLELKERKKIYSHAMNQLGTDLFKRGYIKAALNTFLRSAEADPNAAKACNNLGVLYMQSGERNKALPYFARALELSPDNPHISLNVAELLKSLCNMKTEGKMSLIFDI